MIEKTAVAIIITDDSNRVLLMKRAKGSRNQVGLWESGGGEVEQGELPEEAVKREALEELGVDVIVEKLLFAYDPPMVDDGIVWHAFVYQGRVLKGEPKITEPDKCEQMGWFTLDEIRKMPLTSYARQDFMKLGWL